MIDDAESRMRGRFHRADTTLSNLAMIRSWVEEFGRPLSLYVDKASHFRVNRPRWKIEEELSDKAPETQIQRAMGELGVKVIWANSPQAKGRVERLFKTLQDRLVKGMRLADVRTLEEANGYLEEVFIPEWEERWTVPPKSEIDAHRPLDQRMDRDLDLDAIFSVREERTVRNDYTISWNRRVFQIARQIHPSGLRGGRVNVETRLDGALALLFKGVYLEFCEIENSGSGRRRRPAPEMREASKTLEGAVERLPGL